MAWSSCGRGLLLTDLIRAPQLKTFGQKKSGEAETSPLNVPTGPSHDEEFISRNFKSLDPISTYPELSNDRGESTKEEKQTQGCEKHREHKDEPR